MSADKRSNMEVESDQELEDAIFEELSKRPCLNQEQEETVEEQFQESLNNIKDQAAIDRQKLVKKACDHYVNRNGCAPTVEELEDLFESLADKAFEAFAPEQDDEDESSDSEDDVEEESAINVNVMSKQLMSQVNDALDFVHQIAKQDKKALTKSIQQKWQEQNGSEISAEETEAVFAVLGKLFKDGPSSVSPGDEDEEDADYELTEQDKQMEQEDAEKVEDEDEEEDEIFISLADDLEELEAPEETSDAEEDEEDIVFETNVEVGESLIDAIKKICPEATEEDINDVLTTKIVDAQFDEEDDEDYETESDVDEEEEEVFEDFSILSMEVETEQTKQIKFLDAEFDDSDGEEYGFDDFARDHQDEQDSDQYSDSDDEADESAQKFRPTGSVEKVEDAPAKAMDIEQDEDAQILA